ncbi:MAG: glycine--tRNA ligase [Phycisphaerales bacterium]
MTTPTAANTPATKSMEDIVALCKRRGFIFPASEIYGGINGFWDFGPLGVELKNNLRDAWWHDMVRCPPEGPDGDMLTIVGLDSSIIQNPKVWEASGHVGGFNDPMVDCTETKKRYRADQVLVMVSWDLEEEDTDHKESDSAIQRLFAFVEADDDSYRRARKKAAKYGTKIGVEIAQNPMVWPLTHAEFEGAYGYIVGPDTESPGTLTEPRQFNLMFKTSVGAVQDEDSIAYLRPETAQGIFLNFKNVIDTQRVKIPFGIAQIGKAFRNEVTPRNYIFRSREFEQMEMEFFCHESEASKWYEFWVQTRLDWWKSLGISADNLQRREHEAEELSHYSTACADVEYRYPFTAPGFGELEGIAHRGCFDLTQHQEHSGAKLTYFEQERNEHYLPHVIEPAAGLSRGVLVLLCEAYTPDPERPSKVYMKFHPRMAPIKAAIFPLVAKDGMPEVAQKVYDALRTKYAVQLDVKQNIGKRYARMDEAGTPYCFTIDGQTLQDQTVTVRERDTLSQVRINIDQVGSYLRDRIGG